MQNFGKILTIVLVCAALSAPMQAFALGPFLPFGGRIVSPPIPCASPWGPAVWITVAPFGIPGTIPFNFIVTLPTFGSLLLPLPSLPPTHPGQQILGTYLPAPSTCLFGITPLPGFQVLTENASIAL